MVVLHTSCILVVPLQSLILSIISAVSVYEIGLAARRYKSTSQHFAECPQAYLTLAGFLGWV